MHGSVIRHNGFYYQYLGTLPKIEGTGNDFAFKTVDAHLWRYLVLDLTTFRAQIRGSILDPSDEEYFSVHPMQILPSGYMGELVFRVYMETGRFFCVTYDHNLLEGPPDGNCNNKWDAEGEDESQQFLLDILNGVRYGNSREQVDMLSS